jgi:ABC-2 type transport system ATP-binding protein
MRTVLGMYRADGGYVSVFDKDAWKDADDIHKLISYVPGDVNLWPNLTGGEVIDLFINLKGKKGSNRRDELIQRFRLDPRKKCRTYSKGNRQKVALIAAFATDSDFYIFDEPTSGLDPLMYSVFCECLLEVKKAGKSVLLSSHILSEVEKLCDRIAIIRDGKIIENGTLDELRHLTRTNIRAKTQKAVTELGKREGVYALEYVDGYSLFQVDSNLLGDVITYLSGHGILDLQSSPPSLEDLFMSHYKGRNR